MASGPLFFDCGSCNDSELFIVEGKHAANAVKRIRQRKNQAILAMQGKVPNYARQGLHRKKKDGNPFLQSLASMVEQSLGTVPGETEPRGTKSRGTLGFSRFIVLCDPDADGMHAAMLLICYLFATFPSLVQHRMLFLVRTPLYLVTVSGKECAYYSEREIASFRQRSCHTDILIQRFKGVASLPCEILYRLCVNPTSRTIEELSLSDCAAISSQLA